MIVLLSDLSTIITCYEMIKIIVIIWTITVCHTYFDFITAIRLIYRKTVL